MAGQSAGAHLAACALIEQAIKEIRVGKGLKSSDESDSGAALSWRASQFKGYFGISGGSVPGITSQLELYCAGFSKCGT